MKSKINIPKSFFSFLIASFFIWLLINLSKEYTVKVPYNITYEKLPQHKVFQEDPLKKISLRVRATGFKLLSSNFFTKKITFYLDRIKYTSDNRYYILTRNQERIIQDQLYRGLDLVDLERDTVFLKLGSLASKKVPIISNFKITYAPGYDTAGPIKMSPDSVLISGPKLQIDAINNIKTALFELNNVSNNIEETLTIQLPKVYNKVKMNTNKVNVSVAIDEFTEGAFFIPFEIKNLPKDTEINTFPKKIKIVYKVGLKNFNKITANSFKVSCDYLASKTNDLPYMIPKLDVKSSLVSSVRLVPTKIEFLTHK